MQLAGRPPIAPRLARPLVVAAGAAAAAGAGWLSAERSPFVAGGLIAGSAFLVAVLRRPVLALYGLIAVIALLPFGVLPLRLGLAPTLLDLTTLLVFLLWLALAAAGRAPARLAGPGAALLVFATVSAAAYVLSGDALRADEYGRTFLKLVLATLLFIPVLNLAARPETVRRLTGWLLLVAAGEAFAGLVLYAAPRALSYRALVALGPLGYPTDGSVLRYRPDTEILRATGTSVDPNMLGALLMVAGAIACAVFLAPRPALPRWLTAGSLALVLPCLLLTESRGSWLGLAAGVGLVAVLRHRRLLAAGVLLLPLLLVTPVAARYTDHLVSGLRAQDRASAMRIGEIENAVAVIADHPWFGVGWGEGGQSIELSFTLGVSNVFLTVAERSGLPATVAYLAVLATLAGTLWPAVRRRRRDPADDGLLMGCAAALTGALVAGMLDHHFVRFPHLVSLLWVVAGLAVSLALAPDTVRVPGGRRRR
jgi:polysaccharide biosynthesis protein PslJ